MEKVLTKYWDDPEYVTLSGYMKRGGYEALKKALKMSPQDIIDEVKKANLNGRGGAGFPAGIKWGFMPKDPDIPKFFVVNADEGEPGTFKDRYIMLLSPHQLIEGIVIASYAVGANNSFIYIRGEFRKEAGVIERAIWEAEEKGFLGKNILGSGFDLKIVVHRGAGAYICGEETALIESIEGKPGNPRLKPPFPAQVGVFGYPTTVNNVETVANVPHIINNGGEWFASLGTEQNGGTKLYCLSGRVKRPGLYELPMGTPLREIIYEHGGGIIEDRKLKAVIPGGSSAPVLRPDEIDVKMDFASLAKIGSMLGSGGVIVMDETVCLVRSLMILSRFYAHESCGQCTPCREGTYWLYRVVERIERGEGRMEDIDLLKDITASIMGHTICPLGDAASMPVNSFVDKFRDEFEVHIREKRCPYAPFDLLPSDRTSYRRWAIGE